MLTIPSLFYSNADINSLYSILNTELSKLCVWFQANKLSLNTNKTNYILFSHKNMKTDPNISLCMQGIKIERVESTKFLGVVIDEKLTWKKHIDYIKLKIAKALGVMNRVRNTLPHKILLLLYQTLILPLLLYCIIIWGSAKMSNLNKLLLLQKRAVRLCTAASFRAPSNPLFLKLKLLKVVDIFNVCTALFMFKLKWSILPLSCTSLVTFCCY